MGPGARLFGLAWASMAAMIPPAILAILLGGARAGQPFYLIWPALAFVLYGGAWVLLALARRSCAAGWVALGCFVTSLLSALLIRDLSQWLVMAAGRLAFVALPGLV